jgi:Zn-dependent protease
VLYALGDPLSFLLLLVSFVVAVTILGWVSALVASRAGERTVAAERRTSPDPRRHLDPFGVVAAAIAGVGYAKPVPSPDRRRTGARVAMLLSGPLVTMAIGFGSLVAFRLAGGLTRGSGLTIALQYGASGDLVLRALLLFGLSCVFVAALSLVPIPPLPGGQLLFGLVPRTPGWQKAEHQLAERGIGVAVLLALLIIPLGGPQALLPVLLDTLVSPLVGLVTGG